MFDNPELLQLVTMHTMGNLRNCAKYVAIPKLNTIESKLNEDSGIYGFDMESIAHTKAICYPYMGHSLCHTISILGPYMAHITRFGKGISFILMTLMCDLRVIL